MNGVWITWENQRRNKGISSALDWPLFEITYSGPWLKRYVYSGLRTLDTILRMRPLVVAAQNPSIMLAALVIMLKHVLGYKVVIDAHNSGIYPMEGQNAFLMAISRWLQRHADLTIVTNTELKAIVESHGGRAFVLPDRLPDVPEAVSLSLQGRVNIAFICSYSADEPFQEVFEAARLLPEDIMIYVTGKYKGKVDEHVIPDNVKLLGFVPDDRFWALLSSVDFILDLTLREGCLVCGAYEGVALGKPLILSDTKALRAYFSQGCLYVAPSGAAIASGIMNAISQRDALIVDIHALKDTLQKSWSLRLQAFQDTLSSL